MPQLIRKEVYAKDGEVKIHLSLDLNININSEGVKTDIKEQIKKEKEEEEKVEWLVPDFTTGKKVKFGKETGEQNG